MPRLPVDGKKVIEHRITFGTKERELIQDLVSSYRISAFSGNDSLVEVLGDGSKVLAAVGTIGALLELAGITDVFDFDDALREEIQQARESIEEKIKEKGADIALGVASDIRNPITSILFPWTIPFRAASEFV